MLVVNTKKIIKIGITEGIFELVIMYIYIKYK